MKRAQQTAVFIGSAKTVFAVLGFIIGVTMVISGLTHTQTVGLFQKEADVLWPVVVAGAGLLWSTVVLYVALSWAEQTLLALVMIATGGVPYLALKPAEDALKKLAAERFAADADQAMKLGNDK